MTRDEVLRLLASVHRVNGEIAWIQERIKRLDASRQRITPAYSAVPGRGENKGAIEHITARIMELEARLETLQSEYTKQYKLVESAICLVAKQDYQVAEILSLRYLDDLNWTAVIAIMSYARSYAFRLHNRGIKILRGLKKLAVD